ncbi:MAG: EAL domain-containing protein [Methylococcaceae bacterium]|nr:EAL domain-containing protein [Methylococcaceae bacterium]
MSQETLGLRLLKRRLNLWRWRRRSLVFDSTVKIGTAGIGLALVLALISLFVIRDYESRRLMKHVDDLTYSVESTVRVACFVNDATLADEVVKGLMTNRLVAGGSIVADDRILASARRPGYSMDNRNESYSHRHRIMSPFAPDQVIGEIELTADADYIRAQAVDYSIMCAVILLLEVIAVAGAVAWVMLRRVVAPIRALSARTNAIRIGSGGHVVAPADDRDNEIGQLASDFNRMIDSMNASLAAEQSMRKVIAVNENRFRTLVENSPDIIVRYNTDCRLIFANPAYARETGFSVERVLNKRVGELGLWRADTAPEEFCELLLEVMHSGKPGQTLFEWCRPDGRWVSHEMYVVAEYDEARAVSGALAIGRDVTERMAAERQLIYQASYDVLTNLPNRRLFNDRLHEEITKAERGAYGLALLMIDLDRFKEVNDTMGHAIGDRLLIETSRRIRACVRESDTVARLAGDEFVMILPETVSYEQLSRIAQCLVSRMAEAFHFDERVAYISASIGIAVFPGDAAHSEGLMACADRAMYAAKEAGRNNFSFFSHEMLEQTQQRLQLVNDLREALSAGQLEVHYQPIVEIAGGRTVKAEALLRWRHPQMGWVPPDRFIPLAEEAGLIQDIGAWVFDEAAKAIKHWNAAVGDDFRGQISVNMSPRQFTKGKGDGCDMAIARIKAHGVAPKQIAIEITEGLLLDDCPDVTGKLKRLREAGFEISLDDFGTGYSAMAYLKKFHIDYLKIDRSFIRDLETDPGDRAIAEAIVVMGHRLGLKVIAEGVETEVQREILAAVGCEYLQGYLFAKAMAQDAFIDFVSLESEPVV